MLRNMNRSLSRGRICGTPKSGTLGSLIPSTGTHGPAYTYNDLSLPADNTNEIWGYITTWPSAGVLAANEDTSFTFSDAPDGVYTFQYQLYVNGVETGSPATVQLIVGDNTVIISCTVGNAAANGLNASLPTNIVCLKGNAVAAGSIASVRVDRIIEATIGNAVAQGLLAVLPITISCVVGNCVAEGKLANVSFTTNNFILPRDKLKAAHTNQNKYVVTLM